MGDGLTVTGGADGLTARFDDLHAHASLLDAIAGDLGEVASTLARAAVSPDLAEAAVLCPVEVARTEEALLAANVGPRGAGAAWARAEASIAFLRFSIAAYREVDELLDRAGDQLAFAGGFAAGSLGFPALVASVLGNPAIAAALWENRGALGDEVQELAYDEPWMQEIAARAAPGFVQGAAFSLLGGSPVLMALVSGGHWPTSDLQGAMDGLLHIAGPAGLLEDSGTFSVSAVGASRQINLGQDRFIAELLNQQSVIGDQDAVVQVVTIDGPAGPAYVVQIPGTQVWDPSRGSNPVDLTTNVRVVAGHRTQLAQAVIDAMKQAHIPPDSPVMLAGHSQGGMIAASIAADLKYSGDFNIKAVVTAGSPIGRSAVPADVAVLSLEEEQDLVPKLDGADNPDRPNWVTVTGDLNDGTAASHPRTVGAAHSISNYRETGRRIDVSGDPALVQWRASISEFFGPGSAQRYQIPLLRGR